MNGEKERLTFGLLIDWITGWGDTDFYQSIVFSGVSDFAKENDINLITFVTGRLGSKREWERSRNIIAKLANEDKLDGVIVIPSCFNAKESGFNIPTVIVGEQIQGHSCTYVNNYSGMREVIDHLIETHFSSRIAFIKGPKNNREAEERFRAYVDSLKEHYIPYRDELVFQGDYGFDSGCEAMGHIIAEGLEIDGLVGANDNMIIGAVIEYYRTMGRMPNDIHIAGFDDTETSRIQRITTVHQSFYQEARAAGNILLRLIQGESGPLSEEVSTEMVVRSSCGCIPSIMSKARIEVEIQDSEPFSKVFMYNKQNLLSELLEWNRSHGFDTENEDTKELEKHEERLIEAFYLEYCLGKINAFVNAWNDMIFWASLKRINVQLFQELLSEIRRGVIGSLSKMDNLVHAENLLHLARVLIFDTGQNAKVNSVEAHLYRTLEFDPLAEELVSTADLESQMELTYRYLPEMGIKKGFISIYEDQEKPLEYARLLLAFDESRRFDINEEDSRYCTRQILPKSIWEELNKERFNILIQALHHGESQLGFVIMNFNFKPSRALENIRHRLSIAIKGALLVDKIKNQASNLECEVIERTKELSHTNKQLVEEVSKRKEAEEQLKEALQSLENYARTLHSQSVHDELTGLYNRRGFMNLGQESFEKAKAERKSCLLFYADLDGLKQINDNYGHAEGDFAIAKTAEILTECCRESGIIARLGGDEFTILVIGGAYEEMGVISSCITHLCDCYNKRSSKPYKISISIGSTYITPDSDMNFESVLKQADHKLYDEKQRKKQVRGK